MYLPRNKICQFTLIGLVLLTGCATEYPCGEPNAGHCAAVTDNYQRSFQDYKNSDDVAPSGWFGSSSEDKPKSKMFTPYMQIPEDGAPLVSQPSMLRVWLTPYTDNDNVYHEQGYEYMLTDKGHWLYANNLKTNMNLKNISLVQSESGARAPTGGFGFPPPNSPPHPNAFLNDYPALNALKNQTIAPSISTTTGLNKSTLLKD